MDDYDLPEGVADADQFDEPDGTTVAIDFDNMLQYRSVKDVTTLFRSSKLAGIFKRLMEYNDPDAIQKNAITKENPEYQFVSDCSAMAIQLELEKTKAHYFLRQHYAVRFPELTTLVPHALAYARVVKLISNDVDLTLIVDALDELFTDLNVPSQTLAVVIAAASTTQGVELEATELIAVIEACDEIAGLEEAKQVLLEYIQKRMPLIAPNLCAFLGPLHGTAIASQLFSIAGSLSSIASMDISEIQKLGSSRQRFGPSSAGFLINSDLVTCHPPELRAKALRLVSQNVLNMSRLDDNRRAADNSEGRRAREEVRSRMLQWSDPMLQRGRAHDTYERYTRKRPGAMSTQEKQRRGVNRFFKRV